MIRAEVIINQNLNLVRKIAFKYKEFKVGIEYEDLISYGIIALLDACLLYTSDAADEQYIV